MGEITIRQPHDIFHGIRSLNFIYNQLSARDSLSSQGVGAQTSEGALDHKASRAPMREGSEFLCCYCGRASKNDARGLTKLSRLTQRPRVELYEHGYRLGSRRRE